MPRVIQAPFLVNLENLIENTFSSQENPIVSSLAPLKSEKPKSSDAYLQEMFIVEE